jgi:hypothetical protein
VQDITLYIRLIISVTEETLEVRRIKCSISVVRISQRHFGTCKMRNKHGLNKNNQHFSVFTHTTQGNDLPLAMSPHVHPMQQKSSGQNIPCPNAEVMHTWHKRTASDIIRVFRNPLVLSVCGFSINSIYCSYLCQMSIMQRCQYLC